MEFLILVLLALHIYHPAAKGVSLSAVTCSDVACEPVGGLAAASRSGFTQRGTGDQAGRAPPDEDRVGVCSSSSSIIFLHCRVKSALLNRSLHP